jgi:hypothetical protein
VGLGLKVVHEFFSFHFFPELVDPKDNMSGDWRILQAKFGVLRCSVDTCFAVFCGTFSTDFDKIDKAFDGVDRHEDAGHSCITADD